MSNSQDFITKDIVGVDVLKASDCHFPVPFNVPAIKSIPLSAMPTAYYNFGVNPNQNANYSDEVDGDIAIKSTNKQSVQGNIFTYDVTATIPSVSSIPDSIESGLYHQDFHLIIYFADGTSKLCYGLPNTTIFTSSDNLGSNSSNSIKITVQSMNKLIDII